MRPFSQDAGIPVLTEVIAPAALADARLGRAPTEAPASDGESGGAPASTLSRDEFDRIADIVLERVLAQLQSRFDTLLGPQLEARLSEKLQDIAAELAGEIRHDVQQELESMIAATKTTHRNNPDFTKE